MGPHGSGDIVGCLRRAEEGLGAFGGAWPAARSGMSAVWVLRRPPVLAAREGAGPLVSRGGRQGQVAGGPPAAGVAGPRE